MDDLIKVIIKVIKKEDKLDTFSKGGDQRRKKAKKVVLFYSDQQTVFSTLATLYLGLLFCCRCCALILFHSGGLLSRVTEHHRVTRFVSSSSQATCGEPLVA